MCPEFKEWVANIKSVPELIEALKKLNADYEPHEDNPSFKVSRQLQKLSFQNSGLTLKVKYKDFPEEEGTLIRWGGDDWIKIKCDKQTDLSTTYRYKDIVSFDLRF